jgi:Glycosyl transferase family 2
MSDSEPLSAPDPLALTELAHRLQELSLRVELLDERNAQRHAELDAHLRTVLLALELIHDDDPGARRRLRQLRIGEDYAEAFTQPDPLVSVVIPTWDRVDTLIERAIPSALGQTHSNIEVIVVGDASPARVEQAVTALADPRVTFHNLTHRGPYDDDHYRSWLASGTPGLNAGVALARGLWIAPLGDDDEFEPNHVELLLGKARKRRLEFVYGRGRVLLPDGRETLLGEFPPRLTQIGLQAAVFHAGLSFLELELGHALFGKPNDWGLVHRMLRIGVRMGMVDETTVVYHPSLRAQTPRQEQGNKGSATVVMDERSSQIAELSRQASVLERTLEHERALASDLHRRLEEVHSSRSWKLTAPLRRLRIRRRQR